MFWPLTSSQKYSMKLAIAALVFAEFAAWGSTPAGAIHYHRAAQSGQVTMMRRYGNWHRDCQSQLGVVRPLSKPAHGKLSTRQVSGLIKSNRFNPTDSCIGRTIEMVQIDYRPDPGYRGADTFSIEASWGANRRGVDTFSIDVR
jgi:hypothetical protein